MDADLGKSALMHIARLMNNLVKRSKKNGDKSAVAMPKKNEHHHRTGRPVVNRDENRERSGRPDINRDTCHELKRGLLDVDHRAYDIWVVSFKT